MSELRSFTLGQILSVTTGKLLCPFSDVHELLTYMTGENLFTHQLGRASGECTPDILRQHPQLAEVDVSDASPDTWKAVLQREVDRFGPSLVLRPLAAREPQYDTPVADLIEMVGDPTKVVVIDA